MSKRCDNCIYAEERVQGWYECRYHAPRPELHDPNWRHVKPDFWCGQFDSKSFKEELSEMYRPKS